MDSIPKVIDGYVEKITAMFEGKIDFEGQRKADKLNNWILSLTTVVALIAGYVLQSMLLTFGIYGAGFLTALLVVVPPWPCYNKHPVSWLPSLKKQGKNRKFREILHSEYVTGKPLCHINNAIEFTAVHRANSPEKHHSGLTRLGLKKQLGKCQNRIDDPKNLHSTLDQALGKTRDVEKPVETTIN
ncbi:hypothetical protein PCASD_12917 [Puccinia coronata f. sp. avenae]|uniref:Signal peptidase complex subunit 1 n=1 Tax=Puccinia coronata f. sp. avenae TaxID=200324 RepID=A0A2N5U9Y9_9BASI|nr:hypothetical protein PCASD_12917 [Puccinia coronata f. sp. avenae]